MIFDNLCPKDDTSWLVEKVLLLYQVKLQDKTNEPLSIDIDDDHIFTETEDSGVSQLKQSSAIGE